MLLEEEVEHCSSYWNLYIRYQLNIQRS